MLWCRSDTTQFLKVGSRCPGSTPFPGQCSLCKGSPGLQLNTVDPAIFNNALAGIPIERTPHVSVNCCIVEHSVNRVIFDLVHNDRFINKGSQQLDLCWRMVADPEF